LPAVYEAYAAARILLMLRRALRFDGARES